MSRPLRHVVFLICGLVALVQGLEAFQHDPAMRPKSIRISVDQNGITANNGVEGLTRDKVWALAGHNVAFVIENRDKVSHHVRIPVKEFQPSPRGKPLPGGLATPDPLVAGQKDEVDVAPGEVAVIMLRVRPRADLFNRKEWLDDPNLSMTYKYSIHTIPSGRKEILLDPDIEIDQV